MNAYLDILEQTLLCVRLPAYEGKRRVKERKHPKLFWVDPGLVRAAKQQLQPTLAAEVKSGAVFNETWCKGLRAFGAPPGVVRRLVVGPDTPDMRLPDGIEVLSYRRLASHLHAGTLF